MWEMCARTIGEQGSAVCVASVSVSVSVSLSCRVCRACNPSHCSYLSSRPQAQPLAPVRPHARHTSHDRTRTTCVFASLQNTHTHARPSQRTQRHREERLWRGTPTPLGVFVWPSQPEMLGPASARLRQLFPQQAGRLGSTAALSRFDHLFHRNHPVFCPFPVIRPKYRYLNVTYMSTLEHLST